MIITFIFIDQIIMEIYINIKAEVIHGLNDLPPQLTFLVNGLKSEKVVKFEYNKASVYVSPKERDIENPFEICVNANCERNIEKYTFSPDNSYKIIVHVQVIIDDQGKSNYVLPVFLFHKENGVLNTGRFNKINMKFIFLYLILLLFL